MRRWRNYWGRPTWSVVDSVRRCAGLLGRDRRRRRKHRSRKSHGESTAATVSALGPDGFPNRVVHRADVGEPVEDPTATIGRVVRGYDSKLPIMQLVTVNDSVDQQLLVPRLAASVLAGFSLTALVLAALGLYAVVAFAVRERTRK